jgi:hypothetical protein
MQGWSSQSLKCNYDVAGSIPSQSMGDCGGKSRTGTSYSPRSSAFLVSIVSSALILSFIYMLLLPEGQKDKDWEPSKKRRSFENRGAFNSFSVLIF